MSVIMKIKLNSDDNLPLNKPLKFHNMTITIRSVFEEDGKLYPQVFFKKNYQKNVIFVTIGVLKILVLNMNLIFVMDVII